MRRQLRATGGITNARQGYGLGSWVKEKFRKIIPNELADIAAKAAPFVAMMPGWGPVAGGVMRGVGRFDKRGSISDALKQGVGTYAAGKLFDKGMMEYGGRGSVGGLNKESIGYGSPGEAWKGVTETGGKVLDKMGLGTTGTPGLDKIGVPKIGELAKQQLLFGTISGGLTYIYERFIKEEPEQQPGESMGEYMARRKKNVSAKMRTYMDNYMAFDKDYSSKTDEEKTAYIDSLNTEYEGDYNQGGRVGYQTGGITDLRRIGYQEGTTREDLLNLLPAEKGSLLGKAGQSIADRASLIEQALGTGTSGTTPTGEAGPTSSLGVTQDQYAAMSFDEQNEYLARLDQFNRTQSQTATPTGEAGGIITDGPNKYRINADGSRTPIGTIGGGGGIPGWEGGSFVDAPGLDLGGRKLYKSPEGPYEFYDPDTGVYTTGPKDFSELEAQYGQPRGDAGGVSNIPQLTQLMDDVNQEAGTTVIRNLAEASEYLKNQKPTDTTQIPGPASPRTIPTDTGALTVAEPEGIQTVPTKRSFNVMMDPKGIPMKDQSMAELARETGIAPNITNYPINNMSDVQRMIGPGTGITEDPGAYGNIGMGRSLRENIAANEAQRGRISGMLEAGRSRLPGYMPQPIGVMPPEMQGSQFTGGNFPKPGVVTESNPGGYRSEQEAIADLGIEKYNTMYNQGGRVGYEAGTINPALMKRMMELMLQGIPRHKVREEAEKQLRQEPYINERMGTGPGPILEAANGGLMRRPGYMIGGEAKQMEAGAPPIIYEGNMDPRARNQQAGLPSRPRPMAAQGGRIGYRFGPGPIAQAGIPGIPRMAEDGLEYDMSERGGFQPLGAQEGKDDVKANLAKNEFVFTADAVRAAGGGSIQKGAQRMYDTMKKLESRVS